MAYLAKCPTCGSSRRIDERPFSLDGGPQSHECLQCCDRFYAAALSRIESPNTVVVDLLDPYVDVRRAMNRASQAMDEACQRALRVGWRVDQCSIVECDSGDKTRTLWVDFSIGDDQRPRGVPVFEVRIKSGHAMFEAYRSSGVAQIILETRQLCTIPNPRST